MSIAKIIFETIDKVFDIPQNPHIVEKTLKGVECISDIVYSEKYPDLALDLYYFPQEQKYPVIFEIHGGGFAAGDKKYRRCLSKYFAKHTGAMVVNANYGLGEKCPCPLPMQQLAAAVNWVVQNAEKYNMDLSRFVVTGDSAGAYYACFLATLQNSERLQQLFDCHIDAHISATLLNCGVYDFEYALTKKMLLNKSICRELTGLGIEEARNSVYFEGLNLTNHITSSFPETLLVYSRNDLIVNGQGERLLEKLQEMDVPTECVCATSLLDNHVYSLSWITKTAKQTNARMLEFLNKHFGNEDHSTD